MKKSICIYGAGLFGTAIANELANNEGLDVWLFAKNKVQADEIKHKNTNVQYFPNKNLDKRLSSSSNVKDLRNADVLFIAVPSSRILEILPVLKENLKKDVLIVNLSKGLFESGETIVDMLSRSLDNDNVVALKGATFATELIDGAHSMFTLGFDKKEQYSTIAEITTGTNIHFDYTLDIRGVEMLSVIKNIYAILLGIIDAKYNSANTRFMILTKAFSEINLLVDELGGNKNTLFLSCGFGDIGLTALNDLSRNRTLGLLIGKGFYNSQIEKNSVVLEGIKTMDFIYNLIPKYLLDRLPLFLSLHQFFKDEKKKFNINFDSFLDKKMKTVLTYGTFDLLHYGHLEILRRSKSLGDRLVVGVSTDSFNKVKGKECKISYAKRKEFLEAIDYVDLVIPEDNWNQKTEDIKKHDVDIFVMGDDWKGKFDELKTHCEVVYLPRTPGISTTKLKSIL